MIEEISLDPTLEICDPHHHLWEYPQNVYSVDELAADTSSHNVTSTVFVECASKYRTDGPDHLKPVGETEWVASKANDKQMQGIVSFADLTLGAKVGEVLQAHIEAGQGRFRGIRHVNAYDADDRIRASHTNPPPGLLTHDDFKEGFAVLGHLGLSFDAWLYHPQLPELAALARAHPDVTIILDHIGGPLGIGPYDGKRDEVLPVWRESMRDVSTCDNVFLKLGGIGMPIMGMDWHHRIDRVGSEEVAQTWGPEFHRLIEWFGPNRCMFESNFPVDKASFSYSVCWNTFMRIAEGYDDKEKRALFHDTASTAYRLDG